VPISLSFRDLMRDRQTTDMATKTEGSDTVSVRAFCSAGCSPVLFNLPPPNLVGTYRDDQ